MPERISVHGLTVTVERPAAATRPPVLFVHGYFAAAWVFEPLQRFFAAIGYPAYAVTLRGHADSRPVPDRGAVPFAAYVEDALEVARTIAASHGGGPPIVIGHSLGGLVAQKLAESGAVRAAVLICPAPPRGIVLVSWPLYRRLLPYLAALLSGRAIVPARDAADALILNGIPPHERAAMHARFEPGSGRAARDILFGVPVDAARVRCPVLVMSASADRFIPARLARRIAAKYGAPFREYFGRAHMLPAEPGWETAAREAEHWLDHTLGLGHYDTPGIIRLLELAKQRGKTVTLSFRDGHVIQAKIISVDFEDPSEVIYEVRSVMEIGPPHLVDVKPGRVAAAPLNEVHDFEPESERERR
ncbi:MAG: lysophospholipase [Gemmatimonadota bacterium]|nr:lysophospholipase [Gemmatimonadota bacterium]